MSRLALKRLSEWALWFDQNQNRGRDMPNEIKFLKRAIDELGGVIVELLADITELEGRPRDSLGLSILHTPTGITMTNGKRFGE